MTKKRGRPLSTSSDIHIQRRRAQTAARVRQFRQRQRDVVATAAATRPPVTQIQLQQAERIAQTSFDAHEAAATLVQLGLRTQGLTLPVDPQAVQLQQDAVAVDEHNQIYHHIHPHIPLPARQTSPRPSNAVSARPITQFFQPRRCSPSARPPSSQPPPPTQRGSITQFFQRDQPRSPLATTTDRPFDSPPPPSFSSISRPSYSAITSHTGSEDQILPADADEEVWGLDDDVSLTAQEDDSGIDLPPLAPLPSRSRNPTATERDPPPVERQDREEEDAQEEVEDEDEDENEDEDEDRGEDEDGDENNDDDEDVDEDGEAEAEDEELPSPIATTAIALAEHLLTELQGCTPAQHNNDLQEHNQIVENHSSLVDVFNDPDFPSVLRRPDLLTPAALASYQPPTPAQWHSIYCGVSPQQTNPPLPSHVCLHQEVTTPNNPQVAFDIDSFLGFVPSLSVAKKGFLYQPAPQERQNMAKDVHLETTVFRAGHQDDQPIRAVNALIRDVPHFLLGRVEGSHDITIHVLFPHLDPGRRDKFHALTDVQYARWFDSVFHPAVYRAYESHYTQHLPTSFRQAFLNSKAHQVEGRKITTASYQSRQSLGFHLQPQHLGQVWDDVIRFSNDTPGFQDFREPQLFLSAKDTKLRFKSTPEEPTLLDAMVRYQTYMESILDMAQIDHSRLFVDLAKEICPSVSHLAGQRADEDEQPQVYLWRRCCLEKHMRTMYGDRIPAPGPGQLYYTQTMLRDAGTLTSVPPKGSELYRGGVRYFQLYASVKEVWDAAKCMPFDNDGLEELALDPQICRGYRALAGGRTSEKRILEQAYCASKQRAHVSLRTSRSKSFGVREEYRISWQLFQAILLWMQWLEPDELIPALDERPSYVWAVQTPVYLDFVWRSLDKFAAGFEIVRARCRTDLVTWEQTKVMAAFLRCLRYVLGGHLLSRESALWWSRRQRDVGHPPQRRVWYGLGFANTLPLYGYCWLEPRFDWDQVLFLPDITDRVLFGNDVLRHKYLRRGGRVQDFFALHRRMEFALDQLRLHAATASIHRRLRQWIAHLILQQFRVDVMDGVRAEIRPEYREQALEGLTPFCHEYFEEIMDDPPHLSSGNRASHFKDPLQVHDYLFNFDDGVDRRTFKDKAFRKLYHHAYTSLATRYGRESDELDGFVADVEARLFVDHWLLPHSGGGHLLQKDKQSRRMWYSVGDTADGVYKWARKNWRAGRPADLPDWVQWTRDEWEDWIARQRTQPAA